MSTKSVKITNGKILNYKISASGYKTIYGSQLITADTTINKNMIAETDPNGVYYVGDRIGGIASFVCYYTDSNGNKYAVFVADAKYRAIKAWSLLTTDSGLHSYDSSSYGNSFKTQEGCPESATYNNNYIINTYYPSGETSNNFPAFKYCADISITSFGVNGIGRLPNPYEAIMMRINGNILDSVDPTVSDYSSFSFNYINAGSYSYIWTCYQYNNSSAWRCDNKTSYGYPSKPDGNYVIPVFEIPVN